jgi:hypothetical protein
MLVNVKVEFGRPIKKIFKKKNVSESELNGIELGLPRPEANTIATVQVRLRQKLPEISKFSLIWAKCQMYYLQIYLI